MFWKTICFVNCEKNILVKSLKLVFILISFKNYPNKPILDPFSKSFSKHFIQFLCISGCTKKYPFSVLLPPPIKAFFKMLYWNLKYLSLIHWSYENTATYPCLMNYRFCPNLPMCKYLTEIKPVIFKSVFI